MRLYVGNLSYDATDETLKEAFESYGPLASAQVIIDRMTNRSRGFGFVEFENSGEAQTAIAEMDGKDLLGRPLRVNEARPRREFR